jgi:hypothetical protein
MCLIGCVGEGEMEDLKSRRSEEESRNLCRNAKRNKVFWKKIMFTFL